MSDHPIQGLMQTAMENIKAMVDVNTIVGEAVETPDGSVILPISKVGFGFAAGGSDFNVDEEEHHTSSAAGNHSGKEGHPFGGGSGGGVSIQPIAFLVVGKQGAQIVPLDNQTHLIEKLIDSTPYLIDKVQSIFQNVGGGMQTPPPQVPVNVTTDPSQSGPAYL
ncbi:sporulation protein YtfJ [Paenibacillus kribbensis]|uniref:Sporulation protein YtfJ n=1 Tax=Paenibacillus kribbensis TaxID=172713 RepID=A0A222WLQ4_9BACL|nr:GerW family sporulation protein [Paenibacillus kribbensis]ASR47046.1 sporulation protein YtfJ [Paenibacillus kribbensis]